MYKLYVKDDLLIQPCSSVFDFQKSYQKDRILMHPKPLERAVITFCKPQALSSNHTMSTFVKQPLGYVCVLIKNMVLE